MQMKLDVHIKDNVHRARLLLEVVGPHKDQDTLSVVLGSIESKEQVLAGEKLPDRLFHNIRIDVEIELRNVVRQTLRALKLRKG